MDDSPRWARLIDEVAAFAVSGCCAGCDIPGTLLCPPCRRALTQAPQKRTTPTGLPVVAALTYEGVAARCIRRIKEDGETVLARPLGSALAAAARELPPGQGFVPVPTSRSAFRKRGYRVPELLMRRAALPVDRRLRSVRRIADQRELGVAERARNVSRSMVARHARVECDVVVVDDVITTGATLDEAARALEYAGFRVRGALVLAATPRHRDDAENTW